MKQESYVNIINLINKLREQNPLILNITNTVVANYVANGLLAVGASPIMSNAVEEMEELAAICQAVAINIGTLTAEQVQAMRAAGQAANRCVTPVILDPVGVGATSYRRQVVDKLLEDIQFSAIRGNVGEMATLAGVDWQAKGVDAGSGQADIGQIAKTVAQKHHTVAVISGAVDVVSDGEQVVEIANGTPLFPQITGSGCLHGAVCAAFIALAPDDVLSACVAACAAYAIAGELAAANATANGTFTTALLDSLSQIDEAAIQQRQQIKEHK